MSDDISKTTVAELIDRVAQAICTADERNGFMPWGGLGKEARELYRERAEAAINEIELVKAES